MPNRPTRPQTVALVVLGLIIIVGVILLIIGLSHGDSTKKVVRPGDTNGMTHMQVPRGIG